MRKKRLGCREGWETKYPNVILWFPILHGKAFSRWTWTGPEREASRPSGPGRIFLVYLPPLDVVIRPVCLQEFCVMFPKGSFSQKWCFVWHCIRKLDKLYYLSRALSSVLRWKLPFAEKCYVGGKFVTWWVPFMEFGGNANQLGTANTHRFHVHSRIVFSE